MTFALTSTFVPLAESLYSDLPEPDPDYDNDSEFPPPPSPLTTEGTPHATPNNNNNNNNNNAVVGVPDGASDGGPQEGEATQNRRMGTGYVPSKERQALHKELLMNHRLYVDVGVCFFF